MVPTGRQLRISGIVFDRIVDGKIAEEWEEWDTRASDLNGVEEIPRHQRHEMRTGTHFVRLRLVKSA